jgi:molybdopterin synthase catalytic subunit
MYVLGIIGSDTAELVETLSTRLTERGRVATITARRDISESHSEHRGTEAPTSYELSEERWGATGTDRTLAETLDELAPTHDYVLVTGFDDAAIPRVVLGRNNHDGEALATAENADEIDIEGLTAALESTEPYVTLDSLVRQAKNSPRADRAGAIATFTGRVREKDGPEDSPTELLEFETYEGVAEQRFARIREELEAREGVYEVLMHHRTGILESGADIVFVVVLAGHREEAFRTVEDGINRLKDEVPIFKKEVTGNEEFWVHTRV